MRWWYSIIALVVVGILSIGGVAMAHGTPDWGAQRSKSTVYQLQDLAELARRLGAPISIDGAGDIIDQDDAEHGLVKYQSSGSGTGAAITVDGAKGRSGSKSYKFTAGSSDNRYITGQRYLSLPVESRIGSELWFESTGNAVQLDHVLNVYKSDGASATGNWRLLFATGELQIYTDGAWTTYRTVAGLLLEPWLFHGLKMVIDPATGRYGRVTLDGTTDDLSAYALTIGSGAPSPGLRRQVTFTGRAGYNDVLNVDDLIVTQNEP